MQLNMLSNINLNFALGLILLQVANAMPTFATEFHSSEWTSNSKALYFQSNEQENTVISVKINDNGTLSKGLMAYTNGTGASEISAATNMTASPDGLSSQGSVVVAGHSLFVVNAGDNTVSMFSIDEQNPLNITLLGAPASVPGDFPVTVAASVPNKLVCVGTSGTRSGVACAPYSPFVGIGKMDFLRSFDLNQTKIPMGPLGTVSQVRFSEDESQLLATVKGNPSSNMTGFVAAFTVSGPCLSSESRVSASRIDSSLNSTVALFGFEQIADTNRYFVADAGYGAAIISVDGKTDESWLLHRQAIPNQVATCWVAISPVSQSAFVTDPLVNHIVELSLEDASIISVLNTTSANDRTGYIDLAAAGGFVYALSPGTDTTSGAEIAVLSVGWGNSSSVVQSFKVESGAGSSAQGLAIF